MRIFLLTALVFLLAHPAQACRYEPRPLEDQLKAAPTVFIGTVTTVENRQATFSVEKGIKGIRDGETLDAEITADSCAIRFQPGQRWVYLGNSQPSGSLMLMDEYGRTNPDNIALAHKTFGDFPEDSSEVRHGEIAVSCAPWDGAAFTITLDNGVSASVYASLSGFDKKAQAAVAGYQADGKPERDHAAIVHCPQPKDGQAENLPCQPLQGAVYIGAVTDSEATGYLEIKYSAENHARHVFRVKRVHKQVFCG
jgi:hypothetical protein